MNAQLELLVSLQDLDTSILEKASLVEEMPRRLSAKQKPLDEAKASLEAKKKEHDALLKKRRAKETEVEDLNQRITKAKARTGEIKTNKEYQAHLKEIEASEKERYKIEDEILSIMEEIEASERFIKEEEKNVKAEEAKVGVMKKEIDAQVEEAKKEIAAIKQKRTAFAASVDQDVYELYMKVMRKHHGLAVVAAKGERCTGCNMNIMPQLFVEIKKGEEISQCPQCDRILYYKEEPAPEKLEEPAQKTE